MKYSPRVQEIINTLVAQHPELAKSQNDDDRRALNLLIAEQVAFEGGPQWGTKRADPGRPLAKDSIARQDGTTLWGFDLINGATREPNQFPEAEDITGQVFVPVTPTQHLEPFVAHMPPEPQPQPAPQPSCQFTPCDCKADLAQVRAQLTSVQQALAAILAKPLPTSAVGSFFGKQIVLRFQ